MSTAQKCASTDTKPVVLALNRRYLPAFKAGGPVRTLAGMTSQLRDRIDFKIVTGDRDSDDPLPFPDKKIDCWEEHNGTPVYYVSKRSQYYTILRKILNDCNYDVLYLNSFFCPRFTIPVLLMRRLGLIPLRPLVLAPRGEFTQQALALEATKKRSYLRFARRAGLYHGIRWQASSDYERSDISRELGDGIDVRIAPNLVEDRKITSFDSEPIAKKAGSLRAVFFSRIDRKKNLKGAIALFDSMEGEIEFDIIGPIHDKAYWKECEAQIRNLPNNVKVKYCGPVEHEQVESTLSQYHLLLFPTLGENFGHVILEALSAGCPLLISDKTPWRDLEKQGVGWDVALENTKRFADLLQRCVYMTSDEHRALSKKARQLAQRRRSGASELVEQNMNLFDFKSPIS